MLNVAMTAQVKSILCSSKTSNALKAFKSFYRKAKQIL